MAEAPGPDTLLGCTISHYRVIERLGKGGQGIVYRAEDLLLRRQVALKFLAGEVEDDPDARARFQREAHAASSLNHPNICTIYDVGEHEGHPYLVMELIDGQTVQDRIASGPLEPQETASAGMQLAEALETAHAKGIIHRDIKPSNVFLNARGQVKLVDFGLARRLHRDALEASTKSDAPLTETDAVVGTLLYVSPEVLRREPVDARSDLWGLGVVLYEMASGQHPFTGQTVFQFTSAILREPPRPLPGHVPEGLRRVILRCLAKSPADRYQRAGEARAALEMMRAPDEGLSDPRLRTADAEGIRSLAVLPFHSSSEDPEAEYLSWALTERLIYSLGQIEQLHVAAVSSVHRFKGQTPDPRQLGQELNVGAVLTGRVAAHGEALNIAAELVDTQSGWQIWGRQFSRKAFELASIHEEIAREISKGLRLKLTSHQTQLLEKRSTEDPVAYQLYLRGRFLINSKSEDGLHRSLKSFKQAVNQDPGFALAHAGVADAYVWLGYFDVMAPHESFPKAAEAVTKASELDPSLAEAHAAKAFVAFVYQWDMKAAESAFRRAIELNPRYPAAHYWQAWYLAARGRSEQAHEEMKEVERLEPDSLLMATYRAFLAYLSRRHETAIQMLREVVGRAPEFAVAQWWLGLAAMEQGEYEAALEAIQNAVRFSGGHPGPRGALGDLYGRLGWAGDAEREERALAELAGQRFVSAFNRAVCVASRREKDGALGWVDKACEEHSAWLPYLQVWPEFDSLRMEARFQAVARRVFRGE